jgi:hypothetical protein
MTRPDGPPDAANYDTGIDAVLIAAPGAPDRLTVALAALQGRIVARLDWQAGFVDHATPQVIVVEAGGVDPAILAERLPGIVDQAAASQAGLVVALGVDEIDVVAAATLGGSTRLLVDPTVGDCVAAIVVAAERRRSDDVDFIHAQSDDQPRLRGCRLIDDDRQAFGEQREIDPGSLDGDHVRRRVIAECRLPVEPPDDPPTQRGHRNGQPVRRTRRGNQDRVDPAIVICRVGRAGRSSHHGLRCDTETNLRQAKYYTRTGSSFVGFGNFLCTTRSGPNRAP